MDSQPSSKNKIELLPEHIIDQIKAGEVVERPANLIKEIIENALDAKADRLELHLVGEGMDLISLIDNGEGINYDDLPLAFCRHATSKISRFDDLYRLHTFGFRGEALASISAISHLTCLSQKKDEKSAGKITLEGGRLTSHSKESIKDHHGTSLYIKDLFYNTPARLKFVKSKTSEKSAITKIIESFIISHPEVHFSIKWDDADKMIYQSAQENQALRVQQVFDKKKDHQESLIEFQQDFEGHSLSGFMSKESVRSHAKRKQFLFVNGRLFYDKQIHALLCRVMDSRGWFQGSGSYCLFIKAPPSQIDVNVHPSKTTIKFLKHSMLLSMISNSLKLVTQTSFKQANAFSQETSRPQTPLDHYDAQRSTMSLQQQVTDSDRPFFQTDESLPPHEKPHEFQKHSVLQVITIDQISYIIHKSHFLQQIFSLTREENLEDNSYTPLLISEPLPSQNFTYNESDLTHLRELGFIVESIDNEISVVRAIHHRFICVHIKEIIELLKKSHYNFNSIKDVPFSLDLSFVEHLLKDPVIYALREHFLLPLYAKEIEGLFT